MRKRLFPVLFLTVCLLTATAAASPAVTDGKTTGWIAENGYLFMRNEDGTSCQVTLEMEDLLQMTENGLVCRTKNQGIIVANRDGAVSRRTEATQTADAGTLQVKLENGILSIGEKAVSLAAYAMASDDVYLYYVEKTDGEWILRTKAFAENDGAAAVPGSREAYAAALTGRQVTEPENLTVTREALTLTGKDHRVEVMNLITGEIAMYPAYSDQTAAACLINGVLYRYVQPEEQKWVLETAQAVATPISTAAPAPAVTAPMVTAPPTAVPTAVPTAAPTAAPTKTPQGSTDDLIDEDGTVHKGAKGKTVRKIQQRLADLGYPVGNVDGSYGEQTQLAINLFCEAIQERAHSYISAKVQKKLFADDAPKYDPCVPLKKGDRGTRVRLMQKRLKELGYNPGKVDGAYGEKTVAAVALFQKDCGIAPAGGEAAGEVASRELLEKLYALNPQLSTAVQVDLR